MRFKLSYVLAREVAYRSRRYWEGGDLFLWWGVGLFTPANMLRTFLLFISSLFFAMIIYTAEPGEAYLAYLIASSAVLSYVAYFSLLTTTTFTSTYMSERMVNILRLLPLSEDEVVGAYWEAVLTYWGALSVAVMLPAPLYASILRVNEGVLPRYAPFLLLLTFSLVFVSSISIGVALGTYFEAARRGTLIRVVTAALWVGSFFAWELSSQVNFSSLVGGEAPWWLSLIPYIGALDLYGYPLSAVSLVESVIATYLAYAFMAGRVGGIVVPPADTSAYPGPPLPVVSPRSLTLTYVYKDFKLLSRDVRRMTSILYIYAIPFLLSFGGLAGLSREITYTLFAIYGVAVSLSVTYFYYVEGSGAPFLYTLPLTRRRIAFIKALESALLSLAFTYVLVAAAYIQGVKPGGIVEPLSLYAVTCVLETAAFSLLIAELLPPAPSEWTDKSLPTLTISIAFISVSALIVGATLIILYLTSSWILGLTSEVVAGLVVIITLTAKLGVKPV